MPQLRALVGEQAVGLQNFPMLAAAGGNR